MNRIYFLLGVSFFIVSPTMLAAEGTTCSVRIESKYRLPGGTEASRSDEFTIERFNYLFSTTAQYANCVPHFVGPRCQNPAWEKKFVYVISSVTPGTSPIVKISYVELTAADAHRNVNRLVRSGACEHRPIPATCTVAEMDRRDLPATGILSNPGRREDFEFISRQYKECLAHPTQSDCQNPNWTDKVHVLRVAVPSATVGHSQFQSFVEINAADAQKRLSDLVKLGICAAPGLPAPAADGEVQRGGT